MNRADPIVSQLSRANQRMKALCVGLSLVLVFLVGLQFESSADARPDAFEESVSLDAVSVDDSAGFAVFVRQDGKIVIVHKDGKVTVSSDHPMAVGL